MSNEFSEHRAHSAEYFGDTRDFWWNHDFLELMAARWRLSSVREVLDVGCGVGHWGRLLGSVLPQDARVTGVDRDPIWVEKATERARAAGLEGRFSYQAALAESLPFAENSFDLVTCQTVLIHAKDPRVTLAEMIRVARPGGLIAVAEPNNVASSLVLDSTSFGAPIDEIITLARFQLRCERGKAALGQGNNSSGDILPSLFTRAGLLDVRAYLNDKASPVLPPYASPEQRTLVDEITDFSSRNFWIWSREDTWRYFAASGGTKEEFEACWAVVRSRQRRVSDAIWSSSFATGGGAIVYLVSGVKPAPYGARAPA